MSIAGSASDAVPEIKEKLWTAAEVERLLDLGALASPERYELLHGRLLQKMSQNPAHIACVDLCTLALRAVYGEAFSIRADAPLKGLVDSEPQPDLTVLRGTPRSLRGRTPGPEDIPLVVEVADSSLRTDERDKVGLYAQIGVGELWILDVRRRRVQVYRECRPEDVEWGEIRLYSLGEAVTPPLASSPVSIADLFLEDDDL